MTSNDKARRFILLAKFTGRKASNEEKLAKLLQNSSYRKELEGLHRKDSLRHKNQAISNVLFQILQVQEVGSTKEYDLSGSIFKVHVVEDTELWKNINSIISAQLLHLLSVNFRYYNAVIVM